jgi:hypothetical protein
MSMCSGLFKGRDWSLWLFSGSLIEFIGSVVIMRARRFCVVLFHFFIF